MATIFWMDYNDFIECQEPAVLLFMKWRWAFNDEFWWMQVTRTFGEDQVCSCFTGHFSRSWVWHILLQKWLWCQYTHAEPIFLSDGGFWTKLTVSVVCAHSASKILQIKNHYNPHHSVYMSKITLTVECSQSACWQIYTNIEVAPQLHSKVISLL